MFGVYRRAPRSSRQGSVISRDAYLATAALAVLAATPALADPPPLTAGPTVYQLGIYPVSSALILSERGLAIPVTTLSSLVPTYGISPGPAFLVTSPASSSVLVPARYGADTRLPSFIDPVSSGAPETTETEGFAYTLSESSVTNIVQAGGGVTAIVRAAGVQLSSKTAATSAQAQALALAGASIPALPGRRLAPVVSNGGVTESISETSQRLLTGRDSYVATIVTFGPAAIRVGNLGRCNRPLLGSCEGGVVYNVGDDETNFNTIGFQDLYITNVATRTITSSGTVFLDYNSAAMGFAHPAAQTVGFDLSDRFLNRLLLRDIGTPLGDSGFNFFLEGTGTEGGYDRSAAIADSDFGFSGVRGGLSASVDEQLRVGIAVEGGHWSWRLNDRQLPEQSSGDSVRGGLFLDWTPGPWTVGAAAFIGNQQVRSVGSSSLGGGTSRADYTASVYGLGAQAGHPFAFGDWSLTPNVELAWLGWNTPTFRETGGAAPLTVAGTSRDQIRSSFGLDLDHSLDLGGLPLSFGGTARLFQIFGDSTGLVRASDGGLSAPGSFSIAGPDPGGFGGEIGAHAALAITPGAAITLGWSSRLGEHSSNHAGQIGIRIGL